MRSYEQPIDTEVSFLETLRRRYQDEGYAFTPHPETLQLPGFFGDYVPDAVARKAGENVAIEIRRNPGMSAKPPLTVLRRLFEGRSDWHFHIAVMGTDPWQSLNIPAADRRSVETAIADVRALVAQRQLGAAFTMAWSVLEAAWRASTGRASGRPWMPASVVQALVMDGIIEPEVGQRLEPLADLRNRVVHGDLNAQPKTHDVEAVLSAIEETLSAQAA